MSPVPLELVANGGFADTKNWGIINPRLEAASGGFTSALLLGSGTISTAVQTIQTVAGEWYSVSFDYGYSNGNAGHTDGTTPNTLMAYALNGTTELANYTVTTTTAAYKTATYRFQAVSGQTTLKFTTDQATASAVSDIFLDNVTAKHVSDLQANGGFEATLASTDLVSNGAFTTTATSPSAFAVPNWSWTSGNVVNGKDPYNSGPGNAARFGWNSSVGGTIEQTVATEIGKTYTLSYSAASLAGGGTETLTASVLNGATVVALREDNFRGNYGVYRTKTLTFAATSTSTILRFNDPASLGDTDLVLDDVSLHEVLTPGISVNSSDAELVSNGGFFSNLTGWTLVGGVQHDFSGGGSERAARLGYNNAATSSMSQTLTTVAGKWYEVSYQTVSLSAENTEPLTAAVYAGASATGTALASQSSVTISSTYYVDRSFRFQATSSHPHACGRGAVAPRVVCAVGRGRTQRRQFQKRQKPPQASAPGLGHRRLSPSTPGQHLHAATLGPHGCQCI